MKSLFIYLIIFIYSFDCIAQDQSNSSKKEITYYIQFSSALLFPSANNFNPLTAGFKLSGGINMEDNMCIGVGLGIDMFPGNFVVPLTCDILITPARKVNTMVLTFSMGYGFKSNNNDDNVIHHGVLLEGGIGGRFKLLKNIAMLVTVGYKSEGIVYRSLLPSYIQGTRMYYANPNLNCEVLKVSVSF